MMGKHSGNIIKPNSRMGQFNRVVSKYFIGEELVNLESFESRFLDMLTKSLNIYDDVNVINTFIKELYGTNWISGDDLVDEVIKTFDGYNYGTGRDYSSKFFKSNPIFKSTTGRARNNKVRKFDFNYILSKLNSGYDVTNTELSEYANRLNSAVINIDGIKNEYVRALSTSGHTLTDSEKEYANSIIRNINELIAIQTKGNMDSVHKSSMIEYGDESLKKVDLKPYLTDFGLELINRGLGKRL